MDYIDFLIRISIALLLSFSVGLERQWRKRAVGLRTNVLVCLGSFLFASMPTMSGITGDTKVAAQVISGIGFLGAGVIIKDGANIRGLNTAATLWCNAAIGVLCATGYLLEATTGTLLILGANIVLRYITRKIIAMHDKKSTKKYELTIVMSSDREEEIRTIATENIEDTDIRLISTSKTEEKDKIRLTLEITSEEVTDIEHIITCLTMESGVFYVGYKRQKEVDDEN